MSLADHPMSQKPVPGPFYYYFFFIHSASHNIQHIDEGNIYSDYWIL